MTAEHTHHETKEKSDSMRSASDRPSAGPGLELSPLPLARQSILGLQKTIGNQAVQRLLSGRLHPNGTGPAERVPEMGTPIQGEAALMPASSLQRAPKKKRADQADNIAKVTTFKNNADDRFKLTNDFSAKSLEVGDLTRDKLSALSANYKQGFDTFRGVLNAAEKEAQNQQDWTNIVVGVACGVAAGLLAAWVLPSSAAAAFTLTLEEAAIAGASSAGQGVIGTGASALLTKPLDVAGKKLDSSGVDPSVMEIAVWKKAADIYRAGLEYHELSGALHTAALNLSDFNGDLRVYNTGADSPLTDEVIAEKVAALGAKDKELAKQSEEVTKKLSDLDAIKAAVSAIDPSKHAPLSMEKKIWVLWMSSLSLNSNILDLDAIEDHIGPKGLKIVDFGRYTSDADENEAIENARNTAKQMQAEQAQTDIPEDKSEALRILTR